MKDPERFLRLAVAISTLMLLAAVTPAVQAATRPISDFTSTQGTFCVDDGGGGCLLFVPPMPNFVGWTMLGQPNRLAAVDYAGLANRTLDCGSGPQAVSLGTQTSGSVLERPLEDGRAEVTVVLHTTGALAWVAEDSGFDFAGAPLVFGHRICEVTGGANPSLVDSQLQVVFNNTAPGAALPDLMQLLIAPAPGQELVSMSFRAHGSGSLRAAFGVAEGTSGRATVVQIGTLFRTAWQGSTADGFPAERIDVRVVGP